MRRRTPLPVALLLASGAPALAANAPVQVASTVSADEDAPLNLYHTVTRVPCTGPTGVPGRRRRDERRAAARPRLRRAGSRRPDRPRHKNEVAWDLDVSTAAGYQPGEVVTYFCRALPFVRGAFEVTS
jgi:hypothetical protein